MAKIVRVPNEMLDLMELITKKVEDFAWKGLRLSDTDKLRIIANKVKETGIIK
jgi:hypothetical protein